MSSTSAGVAASRTKPARSEGTKGLLFGFGAYGLWGLLPLYFVVLEPAGPVEIVANRVVWSLIFCALLITFTKSWRVFGMAVSSPKVLGTLTVAALLIATNWLTYVYGVTSGHAIETSLGYFINPLVSVLIGVIVLKEKLRPLQWAAVAIGGVAVVVLTIAYGNLPIIAFTLALSFGAYGFVKKKVGRRVDAVTSLSVETAVLAPLAGGVMIWLAIAGDSTLGTEGSLHFWLLVASGVITAVPLLLFGAAASRLPLATVGFLQYLTPTMQFILAITVLGERMPLERWIGFGLVWVALIFLSTDMLRQYGVNRKLRTAA
ncbi:EamA family transporter RarD [Arthrobacter sp. H14]|uniref:EamA family transporter RarD n=1 Tax=Arthrobacter sp. H14 TaxID=1312959 RepID=UPI0004B44586|nr:EamA family transporter RarD [Arthrobacter sp. H14]